MRTLPDDFAVGYRRRAVLAGVAVGIGFGIGRITEPIHTSGAYTPESGDAEVRSLSVSPTDGTTVDEYSGFQLAADIKCGTEADSYTPPAIYVIDTAAETVVKQNPMENFAPGETATYEMGFLSSTTPDLDEPTTVVVHMGEHVNAFEVTE